MTDLCCLQIWKQEEAICTELFVQPEASEGCEEQEIYNETKSLTDEP